MLEPCANRSELYRAPAGRWLATGTGLIWCHSLELCGAVVWARPRADDLAELLGVFDGFACLAPRFDILLDGSAIEGIEPDTLAVMLAWLGKNQVLLHEHVRHRVGVIPSGVIGLALSGLTTVLGIQAPVNVVTEARAGFRYLASDHGDALCDEVAEIAASLRGVPAQLVALRRVLAETHGAIGLADSAQRLGVSTRSLQRMLGDAGVSFRTEQADARFRAAGELLQADEKLAAVAARLGLSEDGLTLLVRARTGITPAELRRRLRGA